MSKLERITIRGFKSIANCTDLPLGPINVLIGANGSGKSNFIEVFSLLHAIRDGRLQEYVGKAGGADQLLHFGAKTTDEIYLWLQLNGEMNQYDITLTTTNTDELTISNEACILANARTNLMLVGRNFGGSRSEASVSDGSATQVEVESLRELLSSWRRYHFHDTSAGAPIKKTCDLHDNEYLRTDGGNLPAFLYFLQERHPIEYGLIRRTVQRVAPFFDDFRLRPSNLNPDKIRLEWRHQGSDAYFDVSSLSDGTLRFIALATLLLQPIPLRPTVILVDEPELGLHPYAITLFASLVKQASDQTQVILSTQSPLLLDHFSPEDIIVAERVDNATRLTRLDAAALATWLEDYSLGQLWEKNELGGRPGELTH